MAKSLAGSFWLIDVLMSVEVLGKARGKLNSKHIDFKLLSAGEYISHQATLMKPSH